MNAPTTKYYILQRAQKPIADISFDPYDVIAGVLYGIYSTSDPGEITKLDELVGDKKNGLSEITADEYFRAAQKKTRISPELARLKPKIQPVIQETPMQAAHREGLEARAKFEATQVPLGAIKGSGNVVVNDDGSKPVEKDGPGPDAGSAPVSAIEEALKIAEVSPPPTATVRQSGKQSKQDKQKDS